MAFLQQKTGFKEHVFKSGSIYFEFNHLTQS